MQELQRSRTSRRLKNYDESILWIDFSRIAETVGSVEDEQLWNQKGPLNPGTRSWMEIAASGVATSTSLVGRRVS